MPRVKCDVLDRNREKILTRIATRGVVKFFNVCNNEQKDVESKLNTTGTTERKRDKILGSRDTGSFLDQLKQNETDESEDERPGSDQEVFFKF